MPGKRIPDLPAIAGASTANDDNLVIFDTDANTTKRILRSQLAAGIVGDLPYTPSGGISATTVPTAIAELDSEAAKSAALAASSGASLVGFLQSGSGAVPTTVQTKLRESLSAKDFGAVGNGVADDTAAIQAAANVCLSLGKTLFVPAGTYKITSTITISGISAVCEDARTTKFQAVGNFTAFKFLCAGKTLKNFNLWFTPPVSSAAVGYQFGEGATQFARNVVENFSVRFASTAFFASSDMWGNVFTQMNADYPLSYGYNFTANPSGTTNSFRNLYAVNAHTRGSINSGTPTLTVTDATNMSAGQTWVVLGAGATGALVTTIVSVVGNTVTLAANAANTVSDVPVLSSGTAWRSDYSDTHFYNAYFDAYPSTANGLVGAVYFADSNVTADCIRFESCAVISNNSAFIDDRSGASKIGSILSFATLVDSGPGNYGFVYRCGANSLTQHTVGDVSLEGFAHWSGGLKKLRVSSNDNLTFLGKGASSTDSDDNGYEGCLFYSDIVGRVNSTSTPTTGNWDIGDHYFFKSPVAGGATGGVCLSPGTFGTLSGVTADTVSGSNKITLSGLSILRRNQYITIAGVSGVFKVLDIKTGTPINALVVPAPGATVTGAAVSYATPTFAKSGNLELSASTTWDPPSVGIGGATTTTIAVTGAAVGDYVVASFDQSLQSLQLTAYVYTTNGVAVTLSNSLSGAVDLPSGTLRVRVIKQ